MDILLTSPADYKRIVRDVSAHRISAINSHETVDGERGFGLIYPRSRYVKLSFEENNETPQSPCQATGVMKR
jgi:hypothetical protein